MLAKRKTNRYIQIIEQVFFTHYKEGDMEVTFARDELPPIASRLGIALPKNLGDVVYSFRYRATLPDSIAAKAPAGKVWVIRPAGRSLYRFALIENRPIEPDPLKPQIKIPDATPGIVALYAARDEQALLAKIR